VCLRDRGQEPSRWRSAPVAVGVARESLLIDTLHTTSRRPPGDFAGDHPGASNEMWRDRVAEGLVSLSNKDFVPETARAADPTIG
jgi:hypothetical protein